MNADVERRFQGMLMSVVLHDDVCVCEEFHVRAYRLMLLSCLVSEAGFAMLIAQAGSPSVLSG